MFWPRSAERKGLEPLRQKYDYSEISNLLPYQLGLPLHLKRASKFTSYGLEKPRLYEDCVTTYGFTPLLRCALQYLTVTDTVHQAEGLP